MNETALDDLYSESIRRGYRGSREEFIQILYSDPAAFDDMFAYATYNGYGGSADDFSELIGKKKSQPIPEWALTEQAQAAQDLVLRKKQEQQQQQQQQQQLVEEQEVVEKKAAAPAAMASSLVAPSSALPSTDNFAKSLSKLTTDIIDLDEEDAVPKLNDIFREQGFKFEQTGFGDKVEVTSPKKDEFGKPIKKVFSIDMFTKSGDQQVADEMKAWMQQNKRDYSLKGPEMSQEDYSDSLKTITPDLASKDEDYIIPQLQGMFGDYGFQFSTTTVGDNVIVEAPNGKKIEVSVDNWTDKGNLESSQKLKKFIEDNKPAIPKLTEQFNVFEKRIKSEEDLKNVKEVFNTEVTNLRKQQQAAVIENAYLDKEAKALQLVPSNQRNTQEYIDRVADFNQRKNALAQNISVLADAERDIEKKSEQLDVSIGRYVSTSSKQGQYFEGLGLTVLGTYGGFASGITNVMYDIGNLVGGVPFDYFTDSKRFIELSLNKGVDVPQEFLNKDWTNETNERFKTWHQSLNENVKEDIEDKIADEKVKKLKGEVLPVVRTSLQGALGSGETTQEYLKSGGFLKQATYGLAGSAPSMMAGGPAARVFAFGLQGFDGTIQEMSSPEFKDVSEGEKYMVALPIAIVSGVLEEFGFRNAIGKSGIVNDIVTKAIGKAGAGASASTFKELVENEVKSRAARGLLTAAGATLAEAETGALQEASAITIKQIYNAVKDKELFQTPQSVTEWFEQVGEAAAAEAVGGFIMGAPSSVSTAISERNYNGITDKDVALFSLMANDSNIKEAYALKIKQDITSGQITEEKGKALLESYDKGVSAVNAMPDDLNPAAKRKALGLLLEKNELQKQVEGKDEAMVKKQKARIAEINSELEKVSEMKEEAAPAEAPSVAPAEAKPKILDEIQNEEVKNSLSQDLDFYEGALEFDKKQYDRAKEEFDSKNPIVRFFGKRPNYEEYTQYSRNKIEQIKNNPEQYLKEQIDKYEEYKKEDGEDFDSQNYLDYLKYLQSKLQEENAIQVETIGQVASVAPAEAKPITYDQLSDEAKTMVDEQRESLNKMANDYKDSERTQQYVQEKLDLLNSDPVKFYELSIEALTGMQDIDWLIEQYKQTITKIKEEQDAIQKQAAGQVPVQPTALPSEEVAQGEPQAEPQVTAQAGVEEEVSRLEQAFGGEFAPTPSGGVSAQTQAPTPTAPSSTTVFDIKNGLNQEQARQAIIDLIDKFGQLGLFDKEEVEYWKTRTTRFGENIPYTDAIKQYAKEKNVILSQEEIGNLVQQIKTAHGVAMGIKPSIAPTPSSGVSVSNKAQVAELETKTTDADKKKIIKAATTAINTLKSVFPDMDIVIHDNEGSYNAQVGSSGAGNFTVTRNAQGKIIGGRIDINLSRANMRTVAHEVAHAVMLKAFGDNPALFKVFRDRITKILSDTNVEKLNDFASQYEENDSHEEFLVELSAALTEAQEQLKPITVNKIAQLINKVVSKITGGRLQPFGEKIQTNELIDFMNTMSSAIGRGEAIQVKEGETKGAAGVVSKAQVSVKDIDVKDIRTKSRSGKRVSKGLSVRTKNKVKVVEEAEDLSLDYVKKNAPEAFISNAKIIADYPIVSGIKKFTSIKTLEDAQEVYDIFSRQVADNLKYLIDNFRQDLKDIATLWYDGANILAQNFSKKYGITTEQAAGIIASLSPQKDWYQNVRLAEMVMMAFKENPVMTKEMVEKQKNVIAEGLKEYTKALNKAKLKYKKSRSKANAESLNKEIKSYEKYINSTQIVLDNLTKLIGTDMNSAPDYMKQYYVRLFHEVNTTKDYDILSPDGKVIGVAKKKDGTKAQVAWGSYTEIGKAVAIYLDGSQENITKTLGEMHKIRNFYNNIIDPMSPDRDVTMDTHAVAAALLLPLSGKSKQVQANFGTGTANSAPFGIKGLYYAFAEGYNLAAKETGLLPRQVQSITWEAVRGLFTDDFKRDKKKVADINSIVDNYVNKKITLDEARNQITEYAGGIKDPSWAGGPLQEESTGDVEEGVVGRGGKEVGPDTVGAKRGGKGGLTTVSKAQKVGKPVRMKKVNDEFYQFKHKGYDVDIKTFADEDTWYFQVDMKDGKPPEPPDDLYSSRQRAAQAAMMSIDKLTTVSKAQKVDENFTAKGGNKVVDEKGEPLTVYRSQKDNRVQGIERQSKHFGIYFSQNKESTKIYGDKTKEYHVNLQNPKILKDTEWNLSVISEYLYNKLKSEGYDGAIWMRKGEMYEVVAFDKSQIKELTTVSKAQVATEVKEMGETFTVSKAQVDAYHGSPYDFDRFTTEKIGTGEGAQAFGWGLYFTDLKSIAEGYARNLGALQAKVYANGKEVAYGHPLHDYENFIIDAKGDVASVLKELKQIQKEEEELGVKENTRSKARKKAIAFLEKNPEIKYEVPSKVYKVSLHQGKTPDQYTWLEWDKPVSEKTKKLIGDLVSQVKGDDSITKKANIKYRINNTKDGKSLYIEISSILGSDKSASMLLLDAGIDGVKYPAESIARGATSDTARGFNYVVFDENAVTIVSKAQKADEEVRKVVKDARAEGYSEAAIKAFLVKKGFTAQEADALMSKPEAGKKIELGEELMEGYDKMMAEVDAIIERGLNRNAKQETILANVLKSVRESDAYKNGTDIQKEQIEREVKQAFGEKMKTAPSVGKILGTIKDVKKVTMTEMSLLKKQLTDAAKGAKDLMKVWTKANKKLTAELKDMVRSGSINTKQAVSVLRKFANTNLLNQDSIDSFIQYMARVFADANYAERISNIRKNLRAAKRNIQTKIGVAESIQPLLQQMLSINPTSIPESVFDKYEALVGMLGQRKAVLELRDIDDVRADVTAVMDAVTAELSKVPDLAERFENYADKVVNKEGKVQYSETVDKMLEDNVIDADEVAIMRKYRSKIMPAAPKAKMTEAEIAQEKQDLIAAIKATKIEPSKLALRDEKESASQLSKLIDDAVLEKMDNKQLKTLLAVIGNINNGYMPHQAQIIKEVINAKKKQISRSVVNAKPLPLSRIYNKLKALISKTNNDIYQMIVSNPLFNIDEVLGNFKAKDIFNALFNDVAKASATYDAAMTKIRNRLDEAYTAVSKSFGNDPAKVNRSSYRMMAYMLQLEHQTNPAGIQTKHSAMDYLEKTIAESEKGNTPYTDADIKMFREILNEMNELKDTDGNVDLDAFYSKFNAAEKNAIKVVQEINIEIRDKAMYTSSVIRGDRITPLNNYVHHSLFPDNQPDERISNITTSQNVVAGMNPSTRGKSLIARTGVLSAMNFDMFAATQRGANFVMLDYYMTEPIRTAHRTLNETERALEEEYGGKVPKEKRDVFNAIRQAFETAKDDYLTNKMVEDSFFAMVGQELARQGYRAMLASVPRFAAELASNMTFVITSDPLAMATGVGLTSVVMSSDAPSIMINLKSKNTNRVFSNDTLSGRMVDRGILNETTTKGTRGTKNGVINKIQQIHNNSTKKLKNSMELLADVLIATPDKMMIRPIWFGAFANEFERITGKKPDFDKIAANDEAYMSENKEALDEATAVADNKSTMAGATDNAFMGILKGNIRVTDDGYVKFFKMFNSFMSRFLIFEYTTARTAVHAAMGKGYLSKRQGAALLAAVALRMTLYTFIVGILSQEMINLFTPDEEEEEEKSLQKKAGQAMAQGFNALLLGRNFGNATKGLINYGVEWMNEKYLDFLRDGEYDPYKDRLAYSYIPSEDKKGEKPSILDFFKNMMGPYTPIFNATELSYQKMREAQKRAAKEAEEAARPKEMFEKGKSMKEVEAEKVVEERKAKEMSIRIPLELLGAVGMIPLYRDVRKIILNDMYKDLKQAKVEAEKAKAQREADKPPMGLTMSEYKRYFPDEYEARYGEGSEYYNRGKVEDAIIDAENAARRRMLDAFFNYVPKQDVSKNMGKRPFDTDKSNKNSSLGKRPFD